MAWLMATCKQWKRVDHDQYVVAVCIKERLTFGERELCLQTLKVEMKYLDCDFVPSQFRLGVNPKLAGLSSHLLHHFREEVQPPPQVVRCCDFPSNKGTYVNTGRGSLL